MTAIKGLSGLLACLVLLLSAQTASAQYKTTVYVEAECPTSFQGAYGTKVTSTASYSGQGYIKSRGNTTPSTFNDTSVDRAVYKFTLNQSGFFNPYFRVNTNANGGTDSFFYRINGGEWLMANGLSSLGSGWRWFEGTTPHRWNASPGEATLEIANREAGIEIDKIAIVNLDDPAPTGQGGQAYNCPMPLYFEAECPTTARGAYPFKRFTKTGYAGGGYLYSKGDSATVASSSDVAIYPFDSGTSTYTFYFRVDTNNSASDDSWFYRVDSGAWTTMNNISSASGWRWVQGTTRASLTVGRHTLEIRNRENGLNIDRIAFVPSGGSAPSGTGPAGVNCDPAPSLSSWSYWEAMEYGDTHLSYFEASGHMVLHHHVEWHEANGSGGTEGPGSGVAFLGKHRAMVNDVRRFALANGMRSWIPIMLDAPLPQTLPESYNALAAAGYADQYLPRGGNTLEGIYTPPYLTLEGGERPGQFTDTFRPGGFYGSGPWYTKLGEIPDLDSLGRMMGDSGFHGSVHGAIGGTMADFYSPADPFFYAWHGLIDVIVDTWLKTPAGRSWANANPSHPFLNVGFTEMEGWDNADWD